MENHSNDTNDGMETEWMTGKPDIPARALFSETRAIDKFEPSKNLCVINDLVRFE